MSPQRLAGGRMEGGQSGSYEATSIVNGFPGKTGTHGSFGWSSVWLLRGHSRVIMVDTGPPSYVPLITSALAKRGLAPADVTDVLITHSHWDHLGNVSLYQNARRWISRAEYLWATSQTTDTPFVSQPLLGALSQPEGLLQLIDGEGEVLPGVSAYEVSGHTPGHLAFLAETAGGSLLFIGDAAKNLHELETLTIDSALDVESGTQSISKIRALAISTGARVIPGHDVMCGLAEGGWRRELAQVVELHIHHRRDAGPVRIIISDVEPDLVTVTEEE